MMMSVLCVLAAAQHCGGPCEVPRGADPVSADPKYALAAGKEKANWRYLHNWIWTEDGVEKHRLEATLGAAPCGDFGYRRMFVSPAGNGFLVTGNPYVRSKAPPLLVFCDPEGNRLVEVSLERGLTEKERKKGPCPNCDCADVLYVFAADPTLSANGCFVELEAAETRRRVGFFLPLGVPVSDRAKFETVLAEAEWAALAAERREPEKKEIDALVDDLDADDPDVRAKASDALVAKGFLALDAIRKARARTTSEEVRSRAGAIEGQLKPRGGTDIDLGLLGKLLTYPDEDVVRAVRARLKRILPDLKDEDAAAWIEKNRARLKWNAAKGRYEE